METGKIMVMFRKNRTCVQKFFDDVDKLNRYIKRYLGNPKDYWKHPRQLKGRTAYCVEIETIKDCDILVILVEIEGECYEI